MQHGTLTHSGSERQKTNAATRKDIWSLSYTTAVAEHKNDSNTLCNKPNKSHYRSQTLTDSIDSLIVSLTKSGHRRK